MRIAAVLLLLALTGCTTGGQATLDSYALTAPDGLTVSGIHGACDEVQDAEVEEDDDAVRISVPLRVEPGGCDDIGLPLTADVRLDRPLGDRQVLGRHGRELDRRCTVEPPTEDHVRFLGRTLAEVAGTLPVDGFAEVRVVCREGVEVDRTGDRQPARLDVTIDDGRVSGVRSS